MITEKEVLDYLLENAELRLGRPCSDFGTLWRKENKYFGPLTRKAMDKTLWNKYCRDKYHYKKNMKKK